MLDKPGFGIFRGKGFHMQFENGYTVSVQFGEGNYCANRDRWNATEEERYFWTSPDAEIAAFDADGNWYCPEGWDDTVSGWRAPAEVLAFMVEVAAK